MKKNVLFLATALLALIGCVQDKDLYSPNLPENGNDFSLFDKINVGSSLPDGTLCLLFTSYPYEDGSLVTEPVMTAYAPFDNVVRIPKGVDKLYVYANGLLKEYPRGNINVEGVGATKAITRADTRPSTPGGYDWIPLSDAFIAAIYAFYPEAQLNITEADRVISTDLVAPSGVKEIIEGPNGSQVTIEWGKTKVWVTYVGNGGSNFAGDLWFYTYEVDDNKMPINSLSEIEASLTPVFNRAAPGLVEPKDGPGKRVYLGEFEPGTRIGFKFFGNAMLNNLPYYKYSTPYYNNLAYGRLNAKNNSTCGVIRSWEYEGVTYATLGMENRLPSESSYDGDYNDMICLIEANPIVIENKIDPPTPPIEKTEWEGYWLFEDQYPNEGDYDFNDLVVKYAFTEFAKDDKKPTIIHLQIMARGASYNNSFGVNGVIYYENLAGFANVYGDVDMVDQPYKQITVPKADNYIPMLNNGMVSFDLKTFNQYNLDFPNVLEIPIVNKSKFLWCLEKTRIDAAYPRYKEWVKNKCTTNTDWYKDTPVLGTVWDK